jgi:hypothetical protein
MLRERIKYASRAMLLGCIWFVLMWVGFLAMDYQDDILLSAYVIAGASGLAGVIGWFLFGM